MRIRRAPCTLAVLLLLAPTVRSADDVHAPAVVDSSTLSIRLDQSHAVFSSGEPVSGNVAVPPDGGPAEQVMLQWRVTPARSGAVLHQGTHAARLSGGADQPPTVPFNIPLPADEGVYDVQLTLFAGAEPRHASVQVLVVSPLPRQTSSEANAAPRLADALSIPENAHGGDDRVLRLRVAQPGLPHRVVVSFATPGVEPELTLVDPVNQPDIASRAAVFPSAPPAGAADALLSRDFVFWPGSEAPLLLMRGAGQAARIDVYEIPGLRPCPPLPSLSGLDVPARWIGPRLRSAELIRHFEARGEQVEPDDWVTLHTAGLRLVEALHASGANGLLLTLDHGQDNDIAAFLYPLFEREGLMLLPDLQFSMPLASLEALRARDGPAARSLELIGRDGRTWRERHPSQRSGPFYNPLHPAVQDAVLAALGEFVTQHAPREGFEGVAVALDAGGYLQFPSLEWGYDDETIARFERETKLTVPAGPAEDRHQRRCDFLSGPARAQWLRWRATELAAFHQRMAEIVTAAKPGARFVLSRHGPSVEDKLPTDLYVDQGPDHEGLPGLKPPGDPPSRERLAHALAISDLQMAFGGDWIVTRGNDPDSWELRRTLQALPAIAFHRHQPVPQPVVIRLGRAGDRSFLYVVNEFPGPVSLDVQFACPAETPCRPLGLSAAAPLQKGTGSGSSLRLRLQPFGLWAGEIAHPTVQITDVNVSVDEPARARLQSRIARFAARVTEIQQVGRPAPDVHSAPVHSEENRTAEPTAIPPGQALVWRWKAPSDDEITLAALRDPAEGAPAPLMLVSLVAHTDADSTPLRLALGTDVSGEIPNDAVQLHARRASARYSFPCRGVSPQGQLALRIENRGTDVVWIDAVELRAYRITPDDLRELTKTFSALSLAWEEHRYTDCHRLLESHWGRLPFDEQAVTSRLGEPVPSQPAAMPMNQP